MLHYTSFEEVFHALKNNFKYRQLAKQRVSKTILGSSVIRVFVKGTKKALLTCLQNIPIDDALRLHTQVDYDNWHYRQVKKSIGASGISGEILEE